MGDVLDDLANLNSIKRMLENKDREELNSIAAIEQKFTNDAIKACFGTNSKVAIKDYHPEKLSAFLERPPFMVKTEMGGEWAKMDLDAFEALSYRIQQKIKKSTTLVDWNNQ